MNDTIDIAKGYWTNPLSKESMLTQVISMFMKYVNILEWFSQRQTHSQSLFTEVSPLLHET